LVAAELAAMAAAQLEARQRPIPALAAAVPATAARLDLALAAALAVM
jgi:hypothetical protein